MENYKEMVYESPTEASQLGKRDQWRESFNENVACADMMKEQIAEHYKSNSLNTLAVLENVAEKFGVERTKVVLANSIDYFSHDGRISNQNKDWAKGVQIPDNGINYTHQYAVEQQGMIDMLARKMQAIEPELIQKFEQTTTVELQSLTSSDLQKLMESDPKLAFTVQEATDYMKINELLYDKLPEADLQYVNQVGELFREQEDVDKQAVFEFVAEALNHSDLRIDDLKMLDFSDFRSAFDDKDVNLLIDNVDLAYQQAEISKLNTPEALASIQQYFEEPISTEYLTNLNELANKTAMRSEENSPELMKEYLIDEINEGKINFVDLYFITPSDLEKAVNSHQGILVDREVQLENVVVKNKEMAQEQSENDVIHGTEVETPSTSTQKLVEEMQNSPAFAKTVREASDISVIADGLDSPLPFEDMAKINNFATDIWLKYEDTSKVEITDFIGNAINEGEITVNDLDNISRSEFFDCLCDDDTAKLGELATQNREVTNKEETVAYESAYQIGDKTLYFSKMDENDPNVQVGTFDSQHNILDVSLFPDMTILEAISFVAKNYDLPDVDTLATRTAPMIDVAEWKQAGLEEKEKDGAFQLGEYTLLVEKNPEIEGYVRAELFDQNYNSLFAVGDHNTTVPEMLENYESFLTEDILGDIDPATLHLDRLQDGTVMKSPVEPLKEAVAEAQSKQDITEVTSDITPIAGEENLYSVTLNNKERLILGTSIEHASDVWLDITEKYQEVLAGISEKIDPDDTLYDLFPYDFTSDNIELQNQQTTLPMTSEELWAIYDVCEFASNEWEYQGDDYLAVIDGMVDKIVSLELEYPNETNITPIAGEENLFSVPLNNEERVVIESATEHAREVWEDIPEKYQEVLGDILDKIDPRGDLLEFYPENYTFEASESLNEQITLTLTAEELLVISDVCSQASLDWEHIGENYRDVLDSVVDKVVSIDLERPDELDIDSYRYELEFGTNELELEEIPQDIVVKHGTREYHPTQENLDKLKNEGYAEISYTDVTHSGQEYRGTEDFSAERWDFMQEEPRMVAGYTITTSEVVGDVEVAMGENDMGFFGTWVAYLEADQSKGLVDNWNHGHYFCDDDKGVNQERAKADFSERVKDHLPEQAKGEKSEESPKKPSVLQALKDEKEKSKAEHKQGKEEPLKTTAKTDKKEER